MVGSQTDPLTRSHSDLRHDILTIVRAGIGAAAAGPLVERALDSEALGGVARCRLGAARAGAGAAQTAPHVYVIAAGKAAPAMAAAAVHRLGPRIRAGLVVAADAADSPRGLEFIVGNHPVPSEASERAGRRAIALAGSVAAADTLLVLLSGGASALMAAPADGVAIDDKGETTTVLLRAGADIHALNTVRKHLSALKGGRLAAHGSGACLALAISDVVGDDLSVIASGPTVGDRSTFQDALDVLRQFGGEDAYPSPVVARMRRGVEGMVEETPKPGDARLHRTTTAIIGSRRDAMAGAVAAAETLGYHVLRIDDAVVGEARATSPSHLRSVLARADGLGRPACIVSSGETTVHVTGHGMGGRNQEFALAAAGPLAQTGAVGAVASVGTDGIDGPTDAAGAVVDGGTIARARLAGLDPARFLTDNNAYAFFHAIGGLIHTGPTGTNVGDLQLILLA